MTNDPKSAELSAAATRLSSLHVLDFAHDLPIEDRRLMEADCQRVSKHVLATVAADDELEITEAWLERFDDDLLIEQIDCGFTRWTFWGKGRFEVPDGSLKTRGQLRQLCRALNIALQPSGQEQSK